MWRENLSHYKAISLIFICDTHLRCLESFILPFSSFKRLREDSLQFHLSVCTSACVCAVAKTVNIKLNHTGSIDSARFSCCVTWPYGLSCWSTTSTTSLLNKGSWTQRWLERSSSLALLQLGMYLTSTMRVQGDPLLFLSQTCMTGFENHTSLHLSCANVYYLSGHHSVNRIQ